MKRVGFILLVVLSTLSLHVQAKTIYVPADSSTIQKGINGASYGDTVLVGVGIYSKATNSEILPIDMKNGVVLISEKGIEYTWIQANYDTTVIKCIDLDSNTVIKGFKINKGKSTKGGGIYCENSSLKILDNDISLNQGGSGAGIYCQTYSSPLIIGNIISNNSMVSTGDGGGICCLGGSPRIIGNTITYNKSINYGGGIYCQSSFPEIRQNEISWNQGYAGGGIFSWADSSLIIENTISHNRLHVFQAILYGAGLYCGDGSYRITKNRIIANDAIVGGYGPRAYGGAIFCQNSFVEITDNLIDSNSIWGVYNACIYSEGYGAGICSFQCPSLMISNNVITNNYTMMPVSSGFGAGIYSKGLSPQIIDNVIQNNGYTGYEQSIYGSGIYFASSVLPRVQRNLIVKNAAHYGGGLYIKDSFVDSLNNNTLDSNSGGGITSNNSHLKIFNNIISNSPSGQGIVSMTNSLLEIFYNDVWNNTGGNFLNCPAGIGDTSWGVNRNDTPCDSFYNIISDPMFSTSPDSLYYLQVQSSCIDAGGPRSPLDPDTTIADIGAFYYPHEPNDVGDEEDPAVISKFELFQNYPNPFNPQTTIRYSLPKPGHVTLTIYNILGQKTVTLVDEMQKAGERSVTWNAGQIATGIYFYCLKAGTTSKTKKMVLIK